MKNTKIYNIKFILFFILIIIYIINITGCKKNTQIVCNEFKVNAKITNSMLNYSLNTDLPDDTSVWIKISRSYIGNEDYNYPIDINYIEKQSTIKKLKLENKIFIDNEKWKSLLKEEQKESAAVATILNIDSISKKITIRITALLYKPKLGPKIINSYAIPGNSNNTTVDSKGHKINDYRYIEDIIELDFPIELSSIDRTPVLPFNLKIGQIYITNKQILLMPTPNPSHPLIALKYMKQIPINGSFKFLSIFNKKGQHPWLKVSAFNQNKKYIDTGWINSLGLSIQQFKLQN